MKKTFINPLILVLSAITVFSAGFSIKTELQNRRYRLELENSYSRNLDDFNTSINNIALTLNKARFVTTPKQLSTIAAKLLTEAELSKTALSQLPAAEELTVLNRFLSQVGNYAMSISGRLISGETLSDEDSQNIELLNSTAKRISNLVGDSHISYNNPESWAKELDNRLDKMVDTESLAVSLGELEESLSDYPTLVYDGPYSDHILEKEPQMLKAADEISEVQALKQAAELCGCDQDDLKYDGSVTGHIHAFRFTGNGTTVTISRKGGFGVYMRKERTVSKDILSYEQAVTKAKRHLERLGFSNMQETYFFTSEGVCVVNFAFIDGKTICYTDLIKVGIAMDTGEMVLFEASGYISNHTDRAFPTPVHTLEEARELISAKLTVNRTQLALIPTNSKGEERCYEFACSNENGEEILVFINATTLFEENVLILLKSDGGTLVK